MISSLKNLEWLKTLYIRMIQNNPNVKEKELTKNEELAFESIKNDLEVLDAITSIKIEPSKLKKVEKFYNDCKKRKEGLESWAMNY